MAAIGGHLRPSSLAGILDVQTYACGSRSLRVPDLTAACPKLLAALLTGFESGGRVPFAL